MSIIKQLSSVADKLREEVRAEIWDEAWEAGFQEAVFQIMRAAKGRKRKGPPIVKTPLIKGEFTDARIALIRHGRAEGLPDSDIFERVNALPGHPVKYVSLKRLALKLGFKQSTPPGSLQTQVPTVEPVVLRGQLEVGVLAIKAEVKVEEPPPPPKKAEPKPIIPSWTDDRLAYLSRVVPLGLPITHIIGGLNALPGPVLSAPKIRDRIVARGLKYPTFLLAHQCEKVANDGERDGLDTDEILIQLETLVRNYRPPQNSPKRNSGFSMLGGSSEGLPASTRVARPLNSTPRTKDGMPSIAGLMVQDTMQDSQRCLATWKTAMDWAYANRIPTDGTEQEALARVNRVRFNMNLPQFEIRN